MTREIFEENVPLAPLTTLKVGGAARFFTEPETLADLAEALLEAKRRGLSVFILGGGSNLVVSSKGFDGVVIRPRFLGVEFVESDDGETLVTAGSGENWDDLVKRCVEKDLAGVEALSGIPGSVGGTPIQNVGAYGQEVSETIRAVECLDRETLASVTFTNAECGFRYRESIFNTHARGRYVVLRVTFGLKAGGDAKIVYRDLIERFRGVRPTLHETRDAVLEIRRSKSMVIDPQDPNSRSAGSFFKNPIVDKKVYEAIQAKALKAVPHFPFDEEKIKIPAAWLIENSGFHKGFRMGSAGVSERHPLAIVNASGDADAREIVALKNAIQAAVLDKFAIRLDPEPIFVGFD